MVGGSLEALLNPASIALVGASSDPTRIGGKPLRFLRELGYAGQVYPVNPRRTEVQGWPCYASLTNLPEAPDLVVVALPAEHVPGVLAECVLIGARAALIFSAGFAETGAEGARTQAEIGAFARRTGLRVCGPNCIGLLNLRTGVAATFSSALEDRPLKPGRVGFITQSGAFGSFFFALAQEAGLGFSAWINTGNEVDVDLAECLEHFAADPETSVITALAEGFRDGPRFRQACEVARAAGKPVLLLKVGRSASGAEAAVSHTAALATDDRVVDGICRQHGAVRVADLQGLQDGALACLSERLPAGPGVGIVGVSGGAGVLLTDECARRGLVVPRLEPARVERLRTMLPWYASPQNPVDTTAQLMNDPRQFKTCLETLAGDPAVHSLIVFMGLQANIAERVASATVEVARSIAKPIFVTWILAPPVTRRILGEAGIPLYDDPSRCVAGLAALVRSAAARRRPARPLAWPERPPLAELEELRAELAAAVEASWSEPRTKRLLTAYGLLTTREWLVDSAEGAVDRARELEYPVVVKLAAAGLVHKAVVGGVRLGLRSEAEVRTAAEELLRLGAAHPEWLAEGVLVQEQLQGGQELLLGVRTDRVFGPVVSLGLGGPWAELLDDVAVRAVPLEAGDVEAMLGELRTGRKLLQEGASLDRAALVEAVLGLGRLAEDSARLGLELELDVNPLFVRAGPNGAVVADAALIARRASLP